MIFDTKILLPTKENIAFAASLLNDGEIVGMPTETVYGLAANALDENAVLKIFIAKGRPQDNPLIVHINSLEMLKPLVSEIPDSAIRLSDSFWPGPLTMIFQKSELVPLTVTAGLSTVAIRYPSDKVALSLIEAAGMPLAAPSANTSGRPSPTTANHVYTDLNGRIKAVLDGGQCKFGLESTVVLLESDDAVTLLRPGAVTVDMLKSVIKTVNIAQGVFNEVKDSEAAASPGLKHKHYSPTAKVIIIDSELDKFCGFIEAHKNESIGAMVYEGEERLLSVPTVTYGAENDELLQAKLLFSALRAIDGMGVSTIYARMPHKEGIGLAIYNRLLRAAGFEVITL